MDIISFIPEVFLVVIPTLVILGMFIKNTKYVRDEFIPILLTVLGILFCMGIAQTINADVIIQGILCAGAAVLGNQTVKQLGKITEEG